MIQKNANRWLLNTGLILISILVALGIFEVGLRIAFNPVDYLLPNLIEDPYLNHRIEPGSGGHDDLGFRNYAVPPQADIIAIGDSQTYGIAAHSNESWPAVVAELSHESVYNMALGGYGSLHYLHLLQENTATLDPKKVVIGFYFGNDLQDVINLAYGNDNWADYRNKDIVLDIDTSTLVSGKAPSNEKFLGSWRSYLAGHSVLYRLVTESPVLDRFRHVNVQNATDKGLYVYTDGDFNTIFTPKRRLDAMNIEVPKILTAIEITKSMILAAREISIDRNFELYFLLIPTKELVYADRLGRAGALDAHPDMQQLVDVESKIREELTGFLTRNGVLFIDPLPALQQAAINEMIYPFNDGHPNAAGYRIIAQEVANRIH